VVKEAVNAVWRAVRTGALTEQESRGALSLLLRMVGRSLLEPELKYLERAFETSLARNVTVYDALYIALALEKSLPLLTLGGEQGGGGRAGSTCEAVKRAARAAARSRTTAALSLRGWEQWRFGSSLALSALAGVSGGAEIPA
jgi:hypothetical protein